MSDQMLDHDKDAKKAKNENENTFSGLTDFKHGVQRSPLLFRSCFLCLPSIAD